MAERDILNPVRGFDIRLQDSANPQYGWTRTRTVTLAESKPAFGRPYAREGGNSGHTFSLQFSRRNLKVTELLKRFHEQFEMGFFTLIDWDAGGQYGRHYVGRFTGELQTKIDTNGRFTTQVTFEELPGAPMLQYPNRWDCWAVPQRPWDDWGDQSTATSSANWTRPAAVLQPDGSMLQPNRLQNLAPASGDSATHEYRGYGFRLWCLTGPGYGIAALYVDGVFVEGISFSNAEEMGPQVVYDNAKMSLGIHRVQLRLLAAGEVLPLVLPSTVPTSGTWPVGELTFTASSSSLVLELGDLTGLEVGFVVQLANVVTETNLNGTLWVVNSVTGPVTATLSLLPQSPAVPSSNESDNTGLIRLYALSTADISSGAGAVWDHIEVMR